MLAAARTIARLLQIQPEMQITAHLQDAALQAALESLAGGAGVTLESSFGDRPAVIEIGPLPTLLIDAEGRELIEQVSPGQKVLLVFREAQGNPDELARRLGPSYDLDHAHGEYVGTELFLLRGKRRPGIDGATLKQYRGLGHELNATVLIGREGLSAPVIQSAREALQRHGLIKAKLTPQSDLDKNQAMKALAWAAGGQLIQRIGKTGLIYRPGVPLKLPKTR